MATQTRRPTKDAFMGKQIGGTFNGWNGKDNHLPVGVSISGTYKWRSVVYFNIDFGPMLGIESATLYLYDHTTGSNLHSNQTATPSSINVARMTKDWGEGSTNPGEGNITSTLDWNWTNRSGSYTTNGMVTKSITQGDNGDEQFFDVTDIVTAWFNGSANNGFMLWHNNETDSNRGVQFYSSEIGDDRRPKLVIEYTTNEAPNAPDLTSPVEGSVQNSLTPTFSGSANDNDASDYITGIQVQVEEDVFPFIFDGGSTAASDPGAGYFRFNGTSNLYVSKTDNTGKSRASELASWTAGKFIWIIDAPTLGYRKHEISSVTDNGAWINFALGAQSTTFSTVDDSEYVFQIGDSTSATTNTTMWDSGSVAVSGSPTSFSILYGAEGSASPLEGNNWYKWRAKTKDKANEWGPFSDYQFFKANTTPNVPTVSVVNTPIDAIRDDTPDFSVTHNDNDIGDDKMYAYQVAVEKEVTPGSATWTTTGGWDSGQVDTSGSPSTSKTVTSGTLDWGESYRVKARTKDRNGAWSSYSQWIEFQIHETGVPVNISPSGGEGVGVTPTLTADRASTADTIVSYQIVLYDDTLTEIKDTGTLTSGITSGASVAYTYSGPPSLVAGSTYHFKIRFTGSVGGTSEWSALQEFTIVDATTPTISSPVGSGLGLTPTITYSRATSFNAIQYEIYPSTSTSSNLGTAIFQSGTVTSSISAGGLGTQYSASYGGSPALVYATTYKIRARVSSDSGSNWSSWSGLSAFTTDSAGSPVLTSVGGEAQSGTPLITDTTPDFVITRSGADTIDQARVRVLDSTGSTEIWDSGMTDVTNGNTATITYAGPTLARGTTYRWTASYQKDTGPTGPEAPDEPFRMSGLPNIPSSIFPTSGYVFSTVDDIIFRATFSHPDVSFGVTPTDWEIVVEEEDGTPFDTETITTSLVVGQNQVIWPGTALVEGTDYRWKTRFRDSLNQWGEYSAYNSFRMATAPNGTFYSPSSGFPTVNNVNTVTPEVAWTFLGGTQLSYSIDIDETDSSGTKLRDVTTLNKVTEATTRTIPAGYLKKDKYYKLTLTVRNTDLLYDPTPSEVLILVLLDAPDPITGLSPVADEESSRISLYWDTMTLKSGHSFVAYYIYRRIFGDEQWQLIGEVNSRTTSEYDDWYAGNSLNYEYRVSAVTTKTGVGVEMESGDDPDGGSMAASILDADVWMFVGANRASEHIQEIPVDDEEHDRPVQQEAFETLGSDRKVIVRGFVLGHEGRINAFWDNRVVESELDEQVTYNYTVVGRRLLDYLTATKGPHILKSPFGDVWDVEFSGPKYKWLPGGHLTAELEWIETGTTSAVTV